MLELNSEKILLEIHVGSLPKPVGLYYRTPTLTELQQYKSALINVKDGKVKYKINDVPIKLKFGAMICTGIRDDDFGIDGSPISSEMHSSAYAPQWKDLIREKFPQLLVTLATMAFDGVRVAGEETEMIFGIEETAGTEGNGSGISLPEVEQEIVPFQKSSEG